MSLVIHVFNMSTIVLLAILLHFFNAILYEDSESHHIMQNILPEFFIGKESYVYLIVLIFLVSTGIGGTVLVALGILIIAYSKHICGMFKIARWRSKYKNLLILNTILFG